ncbi:UNVERIFIED_CONTAM: hypothetical protein FKN15_074556 [Acipenser sinensis]
MLWISKKQFFGTSGFVEDSIFKSPVVGESEKGDGGDIQEHGRKLRDDFCKFDLEDIFNKDRRRAKSLPAYPEQATQFNNLAKSCRKRVQFADSLGLTSASVRHFSNTDDPRIPTKVFSRLQSFPPQQDRELLDDMCDKFAASLRLNCFMFAFEQPGESCGFEDRVREKHVSLEKVTASHFDIRGLVRVLNIDLKKEVFVRYTFNDWLSFVDAQGAPVPGSATEDNAQTYGGPKRSKLNDEIRNHEIMKS